MRQGLAQQIASNTAGDIRGKERETARAKEWMNRDSQELAAHAAEMMRGYSNRAKPSMPMDAREMSQMLGVEEIFQSGIDPKEVKSGDVLENVRALRRGQVPTYGNGELEAAIAKAEGPGILERLARMRAGVSGLIAEDSTRGDIARVGVVSAATGGSVMGLTAAGQGLMALMEYIQSGTQQQEQRERALS